VPTCGGEERPFEITSSLPRMGKKREKTLLVKKNGSMMERRPGAVGGGLDLEKSPMGRGGGGTSSGSEGKQGDLKCPLWTGGCGPSKEEGIHLWLKRRLGGEPLRGVVVEGTGNVTEIYQGGVGSPSKESRLPERPKGWKP